MRISCLLPLYSIFSFLSICFPNLYVYLIPWLELFQAIALSTFFLLLCEYVAPSEERRELFFASFTPPMRKRKSNKSGQNAGLVWYSVRILPSRNIKANIIKEEMERCFSVPSHFSAGPNRYLYHGSGRGILLTK